MLKKRLINAEAGTARMRSTSPDLMHMTVKTQEEYGKLRNKRKAEKPAW